MIAQKLIDELQKLKNKDIPVYIAEKEQAMGSSRTGIYNTGNIGLSEIEEVNFMEGDSLGAFNELEKVDHIEILKKEE